MGARLSNNPARRDAAIRQIVEDALDRRANGRNVDDEQIIAEHPDLAPELAAELRLLRVLERVRAESSIGSTRGQSQSGSAAGAGEIGTGWPSPPPAPSELPRFPGYRTVRAIDRGGQGLVYEAIQDRTERRVAIKLMRDAALGVGAADTGRFMREVRVLAHLDHPNIVRILGSGVEHGHAYFVMEFIDGQALDMYLAASAPAISDRVLLLAKICDAVNAAHLRGVIHRDLKPTNVLVDDAGEPRVLDFGLARLTEEFAPDGTQQIIGRTMTRTGQFVGSLPWASPEQARGESTVIDVRTDVYALGLLLYHALTGAMPYETDGRMDIALNTIVYAQPTRPSSLTPEVAPDLETVVLKCLGKEPDQRYQSAAAIASDLRAYLEGRPIAARPPSMTRQLRWFMRRNKPLVIGMATVFGALLVGLATTLWQLRRAVGAEAVATEQRDKAEFRSYVGALSLAQGSLESRTDMGSAARALATAPERFRGWEWRHLMARADQSVGVLESAENVVAGRVNADGTRLYMRFESGTHRMLDARTKAVLWETKIDLPKLYGVELSRNGIGLVLTANDRIVSLIDGVTGREMRKWIFEVERVCSGAITPSNDGSSLFMTIRNASTEKPNRAQLRRYAAASVEPSFSVDLTQGRGTPMDMALSPEESVVYISWSSSVVSAHDAKTGAEVCSWVVPTAFDGEWTNIAVSPDGKLAAASIGMEINLFSLPDGKFLRTLRGHTQIINNVGFDRSGTRIVSGSNDQTIRVWDLAGETPPIVLLGHSGATGAWFAADGEHILSSSTDGTCRVFSTRLQPVVQSFDLVDRARGIYARPVLFDPGSKSLVGFCEQQIGTVDLATRSLSLVSHPWMSSHGILMAVDFQRRVVFGALDGQNHAGPWTPVAWSLDTREPVWKGPALAAPCTQSVLSPDASRVGYVISRTGRLRVCDARTGRTEYEVDGGTGEISKAAFLQSIGVLLTTNVNGRITLWNDTTGTKQSEFDGFPDYPGDLVYAAAISSDESILACAFGDKGRIRLWDLKTRTVLRDFPACGTFIGALAFSPDGSRLASGSEQDRAIRVWHVGIGAELLTLRAHTDEINALAWSPDGRSLASLGRDDRLVIWDSKTGLSQAVPEGIR